MAEGGSKLSEEAIFECLKSLNVPVRMSDLKTPSKEFLYRILDCFMKDLEIDLTNHELRTWHATCHFENSDIYEEAIMLSLLTMTVNYIMSPCGLNITVKDIGEPKPKRTKKILNYILVFWNYYIQKYARFRAIEDSYKIELKKMDDLIKENESLDEKYDELLDLFNNMQPNKEELSNIVLVKEEKMSKLQKQGEAIQADYDGLKVKETRLREELNALDLRILHAKQTIEELGQQIVTSPEKISVEIQKLHERIKVEDQKIKEVENRMKDVKKKLQVIEDSKQEEEKDSKTMANFSESINSLSEIVKEVASIHDAICDNEDKVKKLQMEVDRKEESKFQLEQKSAKFGLNNRKHIETLNQALKLNLKQEVNLKEKEEFLLSTIDDTQKKIDSSADNIVEVIAKLKEADAKTKQLKAQHVQKVKEIHTSFASDCADIVKAIKKKFP